MLESIRRLLTPPAFEDEEKTSAAQLLHWLLIVSSIFEAVTMIIIIEIAPNRFLFITSVLVLNLSALFFLRRGDVKTVSYTFVSLLWLILSINAFTMSGVYTASVPAFVLVIILASTLLNEQIGLLFAGLSSFVVVAATFAHRHGVIPIPTGHIVAPEIIMLGYLITYAGTSTMLYFSARRIRRAFIRIRQSEHMLAERNRELEKQIHERHEIEIERDRFFELSVDLFGIATDDGYFRRLNPAFSKLLGYDEGELLTKPFLDFVHPDDVEKTRREFESITQGAITYDFENRYRCKDGSYKWLAWSSSPQNGKVYAVAKDITQRKQNEQALRASEERYRLLFENTDVPTFIYSREGKIVMINARAALGMRVPAEQAIGKTLDDFYPYEQVKLFYERIQRVITTGENEIYEDTVELGGQRRWYLTNFQALRDEQGNRFAAQVIVHDITAFKQAEDQQRELTLAKEKSTFLSEFLANISHDLKTPLTVINTSLYLLERITDPNRQQDKIRQINEQVELLEKFIQDILMVSRLEYLPELNRATFDINSLLSSIAAKLHPKTEKKQINLILDLVNDVPSIWADYDQLQRVFVNLIENALNYTPNSGRVEVRTSAQDSVIVVEVTDTGIGISEQDLPHIFDRFYRADKARSLEQGGTGLGLAIVKKLIEMHGAVIHVNSIPGKGTTFRVEIPVRQDESARK